MTLQSLLKKSYYHLEVTFQQEKIAKLPYYGPLIRGMLGDTFSNDNVLSEVIFKNPRIDVRPYFFYTERNGNSVTAHLMLMGFSEHFIKEVVRAIGEKETAHIGGVKCVIDAMSLKKRSFMNRRIKKRFKIGFISPTAFFDGDNLSTVPSFDMVTRSLVRSVNRFTKYYVKSVYPLRVGEIPEGEIVEFEMRNYFWRHRNIRGEVIPLHGTWGWIEYEVECMTSELKNILRLSDFFQVGRWTSYGFGKLEVI
ncbi:MAG: hypothetical protein SCAL_000801 [Candidatus Syntrophoarchaeum caldarius]|uniref:CRISPR-associated protein Cas6 C-terminal domain-containing protein n=1 Tax=Candidatus Syntropharchaeum caldarium TaxID=1838285 RepID=A0A1F2PBT9_9EURY|nr:MAG: hypothetical protein SCAL_000801 [Candidatus Syntrophoarchaeum caldarius]